MKKTTLILLSCVIALTSFAQIEKKPEKLKKLYHFEYPKHQHFVSFDYGISFNSTGFDKRRDELSDSISTYKDAFFSFRTLKGKNMSIRYTYSWNFWRRFHLETGLRLSLHSGRPFEYYFDEHYIDSIPHYGQSAEPMTLQYGISPLWSRPTKLDFNGESFIYPAIEIPINLMHSWEFKNRFTFKFAGGISLGYVFNVSPAEITIQDYIGDEIENVFIYEHSSNPNHSVSINFNVSSGLGFITSKGIPIYFKASWNTTAFTNSNPTERLTVLPNNSDKTIVRENHVPYFSSINFGVEIGLKKLKPKS